ncbi:hypothetical protein MRX96_019374 [Rhipicephalus microplus]
MGGTCRQKNKMEATSQAPLLFHRRHVRSSSRTRTLLPRGPREWSSAGSKARGAYRHGAYEKSICKESRIRQMAVAALEVRRGPFAPSGNRRLEYV